jgi:hypothetical protein
MGYTHYWYQVEGESLDDWETFAELAKDICGITSSMEGELPFHLEKVEITNEHIWVEGNPSHESFVLQRTAKNPPWREGNTKVFTFCKTARKPYDKYVTALLIAAKDYWKESIQIGSDGFPEEWNEGLELYINARESEFPVKEELQKMIENSLNTEHESKTDSGSQRRQIFKNCHFDHGRTQGT